MGGSRGREASTTSGFRFGSEGAAEISRSSASTLCPIVPDEARTFGMESMFRERGIYAPQRPVV